MSSGGTGACDERRQSRTGCALVPRYVRSSETNCSTSWGSTEEAAMEWFLIPTVGVPLVLYLLAQ